MSPVCEIVIMFAAIVMCIFYGVLTFRPILYMNTCRAVKMFIVIGCLEQFCQIIVVYITILNSFSLSLVYFWSEGSQQTKSFTILQL